MSRKTDDADAPPVYAFDPLIAALMPGARRVAQFFTAWRPAFKQDLAHDGDDDPSTEGAERTPRGKAPREARRPPHIRTGDAAAHAIAAATGVGQGRVQAECARACGGGACGIPLESVVSVVQALGFDCEAVPVTHFLAKLPPEWHAKCITTYHPARAPEAWRDGHRYLLFTRDHVLAVVNGANHDWTRRRSMRVHAVYRVSARHPHRQA